MMRPHHISDEHGRKLLPVQMSRATEECITCSDVVAVRQRRQELTASSGSFSAARWAAARFTATV